MQQGRLKKGCWRPGLVCMDALAGSRAGDRGVETPVHVWMSLGECVDRDSLIKVLATEVAFSL